MKRSLYIVLAAILLLLALLAGCSRRSSSASATLSEIFDVVQEDIVTDGLEDTEPVVAPTEVPEETPEVIEELVVERTILPTPVDFPALQEINSDIYGWIVIEDTNINYPILQDPDDDSFYLTHNIYRNYSINGSVYSEATYNHADFDDPVVLLYGHHMGSGAIFGNLQSYYQDSSFFYSHPYITIYSEYGPLEYGVFAAAVYSNAHILFYNDFSNEDVYDAFFEEIYDSVDGSVTHFNTDYAPQYGDKVIILSTCYAADNTYRYLVMGKLLTT